MTASITLFANLSNPSLPELDGNFASYTPLTVIPCTVAGTNALALTPLSGTAGATPAITAYQNYMTFSGVFAANGSSALSARVGSLGVLSIYKDGPTGPVLTTGTEAIQNCAFTLMYDSALAAGNGGWHLTSTTAITGATVAFNTASITNNLTVASLASVTKLEVGASASSLTRMINGTGTVTFTVSAANSVQNQTMALAGAQVGDSVILGLPASPPAGAGFTGFMSAAGTVNLRLVNPSGATLAAATITVNATALGFT